MRFHSFVYSLLTILSFIACKPTATKHQKSFDTKKIAEFKHFISKEITAGKIAGAEVLISKDNKIVLHEAQGFANITKQKKLAKNSIYYIQSMTKPIISTAIMQLHEKGLLSLEDDVSRFIPEIETLRVTIDPEQGVEGSTVPLEKSLTIRHLLNHTSGLSHGLGDNKLESQLYQLLYGQPEDYKIHENIESRVAALLSVPLIGQPDKQWYYSAGGDLLALIIKRVSKQNIQDYLQENIFDPLEMKDTGYNILEMESGRVMSLHEFNENGKLETSKIQVPKTGNTIFGGTHGLYSTAKDYLNFCQMFLNKGTWKEHQVLKPETVSLMAQNHVGDLYQSSGKGFGLGFEVILDADKAEGPGNNRQLSWGGYFRTHFFIDPEQQLIGLWMTQMLPHSNYYGNALRENIYGALLNP